MLHNKKEKKKGVPLQTTFQDSSVYLEAVNFHAAENCF